MTAPTDDDQRRREPAPHHPPRLAGLELELPEHGTGIRAARRAAKAAARSGRAPSEPPQPGAGTRRGPSRRWMAGFTILLVLAAGLGAALTVVGVRTLRESTTGRTVTSADPTDPGFEALLEPTPTMLVLHGDEGGLRSAALLALGSGDTGGSVVLLPPSVVVGDSPDAVPLWTVFLYSGTPEALRSAGEVVTGVGIQEVVIVDDARWAEVVAPVAPLVLDNPDDLDEFPQGPIELAPEQVGPWLKAAAGEDESELARLARQELFWEAWIAAVAASPDPAAVPGELDAGLGRFIRGLAAGRLEVATLPVAEAPGPQGTVVHHIDRDALRAVITRFVPFPSGTAAAPRTRVRLLDGTGHPDLLRDVAPRVVAVDATIVVVGNAESFERATTEIRYHQPGQRGAAERFQQALGAGSVVEDVRPIDAFDVTIVLGRDIEEEP